MSTLTSGLVTKLIRRLLFSSRAEIETLLAWQTDHHPFYFYLISYTP